MILVPKLSSSTSLTSQWNGGLVKSFDMKLAEKGFACEIYPFESYFGDSTSLIARDEKGQVYIWHAKSNRGFIMTTEGNIDRFRIQTMCFNGEAAWGAMAVYNGQIYLSDAESGSIWMHTKLESSTWFMKSDKGFNVKGTRESQCVRPGAMGFTRRGELLVCDTKLHCVQAYDAGLDCLLWSYGSLGSEEGQLNTPLSVCADNTDRIYIADAGNRRIVVLNDPLAPVLSVKSMNV